MIKFFRRIRQNLLSENNFSKYLTYAMGEIVLVVIGILIALQINNWNEQRKVDVLEIQTLKEIVSDLQFDLSSLENDRGLNNRGLKSASIIRKALESNQAYHDSLAFHFGEQDFNATYTLKTSGYDNLRSLGFQIIANDSIRKSITDLYASEYSFLKEREDLAMQRTYEYFSPHYIPYFKSIRPFDGARGKLRLYIPKDFDDLKSNQDFDILLDYIIQVKEDNLFTINQILIEIQRTLDLMNDYLNTITNK